MDNHFKRKNSVDGEVKIKNFIFWKDGSESCAFILLTDGTLDYYYKYDYVLPTEKEKFPPAQRVWQIGMDDDKFYF